MSNLSILTSAQLKRAAVLKNKIEELTQQLNAILVTPASAPQKAPKKGKMSAAGRAKIVAAQKARWAKVRAAAKSGKPGVKKNFA